MKAKLEQTLMYQPSEIQKRSYEVKDLEYLSASVFYTGDTNFCFKPKGFGFVDIDKITSPKPIGSAGSGFKPASEIFKSEKAPGIAKPLSLDLDVHEILNDFLFEHYRFDGDHINVEVKLRSFDKKRTETLSNTHIPFDDEWYNPFTHQWEKIKK